MSTYTRIPRLLDSQVRGLVKDGLVMFAVLAMVLAVFTAAFG